MNELSFLLSFIVGRAPYFLVIVVGLYLCLTHSRKDLRGLRLVKLGLVAEIVVGVISIGMTFGFSHLLNAMSSRGVQSMALASLIWTLLQSIMGAIPWCLMIAGTLSLANELMEVELDDSGASS
jgi:hypothetical protein